MEMINNHFEQIALSTSAIVELPFPPPKIFTNALLQSHDITSLIRDTEVHERALFSATAPERSTSSHKSLAPASVTPGETNNAHPFSALKPNSRVGRILGSDLQRRIRRSERERATKGGGSDVDVELLLEGAQKLCAAYPIPGVLEKIQAMRSRHERLVESIAEYEGRLAEQGAELERLSHSQNQNQRRQGSTSRGGFESGKEEEEEEEAVDERMGNTTSGIKSLSVQDEEAEVKYLEMKKRGLEDRVIGLEQDLGGLRG